MFTSQHQNNDPYPFQTRWNDGGRKGRYAHDVSEWVDGMGTCEYEPRAEFDNTPNPLLLHFRDALSSGECGTFELAAYWVILTEGGHDWADEAQVEISPEHVEHARKVLRKLAAQWVIAKGGE